ncbi:hypothetical protein ETN89_21025 (plasmid) [Photobacterium damselae subsp. damselae]|uniref:hypothetical protein n=1 Tax=Photobacterium damselae TaxID=38293 RepID=UPI000A2FA0B5|nr:hypothetical protein [Photobacterium damselae]ARR51734.1 hypothetical protein CAY62_20170 [Photobacterium damselae subsp. damselae]QAY37702.1 hypothetical protein ETN89_21025 [Photobacterium damselae subsp. damselae]
MPKPINNYYNCTEKFNSQNQNERLKFVISSIETNKNIKPFLFLSFKNHVRTLKFVKTVFINEKCFVPYAITDKNKVVYSNYGEHRGFNYHIDRVAVKPYDEKISLSRQIEYQSLLASMILEDQSLTKDAVDKVSAGIIEFIQENYLKDGRKFSDFLKISIGHYFWTSGNFYFGRISLESVETIDSDTLLKTIIQTLKIGELSQILAIHDAIGRKVLPNYECQQRQKYFSMSNMVRSDWFNEPKTRGRKHKEYPAIPCEIVGLLPQSSHLNEPMKLQKRQRAIDVFERDEQRTNHHEANIYYDDLDTRNLLFGSGISGTTGTLLQSAEAFGHIQKEEHKKQYCAAILGYLVGGGMHSYHEVMAVAVKTGIPYKPGSYIESLPKTILNNNKFQQLSMEYYDIAILGSTHWLFNKSCLPSHLNHKLK